MVAVRCVDAGLLMMLVATSPGGCLGFHSGALHGLANAPVLEGLVGELSKAYPNEPRAAVEQAVSNALASVADAERIPLDDQTCVRDYSAACPVGWADVGDGLTCSAPFNYRGACPANVVFGGLSPVDKSLAATRCNSVFPCVGAYVPDYDNVCPDGWTTDDEQYCVAPADYVGPCVGRKRFTEFNSVEKASWAAACGIAWPRRNAVPRSVEAFPKVKSCVADRDASCPLQWSLVGDRGLCRAPADYSGECGYFQQLSGFSAQQKHMFATQCNAPWPCQKGFLS